MTEEITELVDLPEGVLSMESARVGVPRSRPHGDGALIVCDNLVKIYKVADLEVVALQGLDLLVEPGEFIALVGASGSGKSTLMNILGGLDVPSAGRAVVAGHLLGEMGRRERTRVPAARDRLRLAADRAQPAPLPDGAPERGAADAAQRGRPAASARSAPPTCWRGWGWRTAATIGRSALSGGEQQRVAIAVALANQPAVLFADEPTGELDTVTAHEVFDLLRTVNHELGVTIVVVTHDPLVSEQVSRTIAIRDGRTSSETLRRRAITEQGDHHVISEEYAVLDRVGRLQLPAPTSRPWASSGASGSRSSRTTSASGRTATAPTDWRTRRREQRLMHNLQYAPPRAAPGDDPRPHRHGRDARPLARLRDARRRGPRGPRRQHPRRPRPAGRARADGRDRARRPSSRWSAPSTGRRAAACRWTGWRSRSCPSPRSSVSAGARSASSSRPSA